MSNAIEWNAEEVQTVVRVFNTALNVAYTGLTAAGKPNMTAYYRQNFQSPVEITLADTVVNAPWSAGSLSEIGQGYYSLGVPDAAWVQQENDLVPSFDTRLRSVQVWLEDPSDVNFFPLAASHPLQRLVEAVSFVTDGDLYAVNTDLYNIFGILNVYKWANVNGLETTDPEYETEIQDRITLAITYATNDVNDKLRGGPYDIPFTDATLVSSVSYATALKAGVLLYEWRGADDYNYKDGRLTHRYTFLADRADKSLEQIRRATRVLDSDIAEVAGLRTPGIPEVSS
jgi:hypothetical protein